MSLAADGVTFGGRPASRRVLLDECVPRRLRRALPGVAVSHVRDEGWTGRGNGDLLWLMLGARFTVFVTVDRNLEYQQNVATAGVAVVVLLGRTNRLRDLLPLMSRAAEVIAAAAPGTVSRVSNRDDR